jgi:hypothetical protein
MAHLPALITCFLLLGFLLQLAGLGSKIQIKMAKKTLPALILF